MTTHRIAVLKGEAKTTDKHEAIKVETLDVDRSAGNSNDREIRYAAEELARAVRGRLGAEIGDVIVIKSEVEGE
jgi:RNA-binding protein YhbY